MQICSSTRSFPVYDFGFQERESDGLVTAGQNDHGPEKGLTATSDPILGIVN
jgi:hypothetical protein